MKVLLLSKYPRMGASSRLRTLQFVPMLEDLGFSIQIDSLFDEEYLHHLYSHGRRAAEMMPGYYCARARHLFNIKDIDVIWLEGESFPYIPYYFESLIMPKGVPYVVDYDDAIFHNYDLAKNFMIRQLLGKKIDKVMRNAAVVVCGNQYLADRARRAEADRVKVVPTVLDPERYYKRQAEEGSRVTIGWVGSPSTQKYLVEISTALTAICRKFNSRLLLVGANHDVLKNFPDIEVQIEAWNENDEPAQIAQMDVGIMPLASGPWEEGKCGYKLIQYMASSVPFVASPVGVNVNIVADSEAGFLASNIPDWEQKIGLLVENRELREQLGKAGRSAVEEKYSVDSQFFSVRDALCEAVR